MEDRLQSQNAHGKSNCIKGNVFNIDIWSWFYHLQKRSMNKRHKMHDLYLGDKIVKSDYGSSNEEGKVKDVGKVGGKAKNLRLW